MTKYLFAGAALLAIATVATPAAARDGSAYVGVDAGVFFPMTSDVDRRGPPVTTGEWADFLDVKYKRPGYDADIVAGYDFGMFRLEAELARKHAGHKRYDIDSQAPGPFPDGILPGDSIHADGRTNVTSLMLNALIDIGNVTDLRVRLLQK